MSYAKPIIEIPSMKNPQKLSSLEIENRLAEIGFRCHYTISENERKNASFVVRKIGTTKSSKIILPEHSMERTTLNVNSDNCDGIAVYFSINGPCKLSNKYLSETYSPETPYLLDGRQPFIRQAGDGTEIFGLFFHRARLEGVLPTPEMHVLRKSKPSAWNAALSASLNTLARNGEEYLTDRAVEQVLHLIGLTYDSPDHQVQRSHRQTLIRIRQAMREQLYNAGLTPTLLASQFNISLRTFYALFANAQSSYGQELLSMRLEKAREMLESPNYTGYTVQSIAYLTGFVSPSHFGQRFRQAFGLTPRNYRVLRSQ